MSENETYDNMDAFEQAVSRMVDEYGIGGNRAEDIKEFLIGSNHMYDIGELYARFMKKEQKGSLGGAIENE